MPLSSFINCEGFIRIDFKNILYSLHLRNSSYATSTLIVISWNLKIFQASFNTFGSSIIEKRLN
jgi:hypothetical protein